MSDLLTEIKKDTSLNDKIKKFIEYVTGKDQYEKEFLQAVTEVAESIIPFIEENPRYAHAKILERMIEPERVISFRVPWMDDNGDFHVNRGYRVEMNSAIGPYKGGLRFHPSVNLGILKFLAFEQVFKNSLTALPMGGGKGGADFDPKGRSDNEVMRFCQSFMSELFRHIGPYTDIPAGDIGVGGREIGYMFGQYKKLKNEFSGVLTGKGFEWGGSEIRPESTGYGCVYFAQYMLNHVKDDLKGKTVIVSGSGNVAQFATEKAIHMDARVVSLSDSSGFIHDPDGINMEKLNYVKELKNVKRGRIKEYADKYNVEYHPNKKPWGLKCDVALPCAIENELDEAGANQLVKNKCKVVSEGANMPSTLSAIKVFKENGIIYAPGKASNAGGVAVSGLEMSQNSLRMRWTRDEVDNKLKDIMYNIHQSCEKYGKENGTIDYVKGANIAGFVRVADAMLAQGLV